jgi:hypothetical protein
MAALVGIEPTTVRLTGDCSTTELQGNEAPQVGIEPTTFCACPSDTLREQTDANYQLSYRGI